jgi:hypothetical protein
MDQGSSKRLDCKEGAPGFAVYITLELMSSAPPDPRKLSVVVRLILVAVLAVLVSPLIVYMAVFGVSISHDHTRWGEMGSAMSGIYSPILALLALLMAPNLPQLPPSSDITPRPQPFK